jgi:hypothetical protein
MRNGGNFVRVTQGSGSLGRNGRGEVVPVLDSLNTMQ